VATLFKDIRIPVPGEGSLFFKEHTMRTGVDTGLITLSKSAGFSVDVRSMAVLRHVTREGRTASTTRWKWSQEELVGSDTPGTATAVKLPCALGRGAVKVMNRLWILYGEPNRIQMEHHVVLDAGNRFSGLCQGTCLGCIVSWISH